jgi:hypothetical protein
VAAPATMRVASAAWVRRAAQTPPGRTPAEEPHLRASVFRPTFAIAAVRWARASSEFRLAAQPVTGLRVSTKSILNPEVCDDIDNDCNGQVDDGLSAQCPAGCQAGVCRQCTAGQAMCLTANSAGVCLPPTVTQTVRLAAATSAATTARAIASTASASSAITILARRRRLRSDSMPRRQSRAIAAVRDVRGEVLHCQVRRGLGWRRRPAPVTERAEPSSCSHDEDPWSDCSNSRARRPTVVPPTTTRVSCAEDKWKGSSRHRKSDSSEHR